MTEMRDVKERFVGTVIMDKSKDYCIANILEEGMIGFRNIESLAEHVAAVYGYNHKGLVYDFCGIEETELRRFTDQERKLFEQRVLEKLTGRN